jgi:hypothetical protein
VRRRQPKAIRAVAVCALLISASLAVLAPEAGRPSVVAVLLAMLALSAGEMMTVTLPVARGHRWRFCGSEVILAAVVGHLSGIALWSAGLVAGFVVLATARQQGRSGRSAEYAGACSVAVTGLAALVFGCGIALGVGRPESAAAAVTAAAVLRHVLAAVAVGITSRRPIVSLARRRVLATGVYAVGNGAIGLLAAELILRAPLGLAGLVVPAVLLVSSYEQQVRRSAQAQLYAELARAQERAGTRSVDSSAEIVLTVAARMLGGADVEMLLNGADGLVRYTGDESGLRVRSRVDPRALDAPWVLRLLASGGVRLTREAGRPECAVRVGAADSPIAFLSARRSVGAPGFSRREAVLVRALAGQAEPWLAGSGALGADEATGPGQPAGDLAVGLGIVREAARRIITNADPAHFDADTLVDELHALERAVAQIVGSAGDGEQSTGPRDAGLLPPQRRTVEWTTTGRLP